MSEERHERVRKKYHILVEGDGIPPPIKSFKEMKFPAGTWELEAPAHYMRTGCAGSFVPAHGLSLVGASRGYVLLRCTGFCCGA